MKTRVAALILVICWSLLVRFAVWPLARVLTIFSDRIRDQLKGRLRAKHLAVDLASLRRRYDDCVLFFCSSAGEYEQAKPLIDRLSKNEKTLCHIVFFSVSGVQFVSARKEDISWTLAPMDDVFEWGTLFSALRPSLTVIVRHELWPAFLWSAAQWSKIVVINAVIPSLLGRQSQLREALNLFAKAWLLQFTDMVCAVSKTDRDFFISRLRLPEARVCVTGDTKYDRVLERSTANNERADFLKKIFRHNWQWSNSDLILVLGSAHLPDVEILVEAMDSKVLDRLRVIVVPHEVSSANVAKIYEIISKHHHVVELYSELKSADFQFHESKARFIIVDELGRLFDLYASADLAWVGGAVHDKVHNVLEAAAWGVPVMCGPKMENSQEAVAMKSLNLLRPTRGADEIRKLVIELLPKLKQEGVAVRRFAESMAGASSRILDCIGRSAQEVI